MSPSRPRRKHPTPSPRKTKQQSITSFFSNTLRTTTPSAATKPPNPKSKPHAPPPPSSHPTTPSTTPRPTPPPLDNSSSRIPTTHSPASSLASPSLSRALFFEDADDEPILVRKRRRLSQPPTLSANSPTHPASPSPSPSLSPSPSRPRSLTQSPRPTPVVNPPNTPQPQQTTHFAQFRRGSNTVPVPSNPAARTALLGPTDPGAAVGDEPGGWCAKHSWSIQIKDAQKRPPTHPDYDPSTLYVPPTELSDTRRTSTLSGSSLTPFQRQFWNIKRLNYDVVILFKKGKFYEMYDKDADIAHHQLGLNYTKGGRVDMRCCGVPEQAFEKHCYRLMDLGYKVGRVEQTETANAADKRKASNANSSAVCERSLVRILTKATVREEGLLRDHRAKYVVAISQSFVSPEPSDSDGNAATVALDNSAAQKHDASAAANADVCIGVCYVDVAANTVNISEFHDDFRLARTERLLACLAPDQLIADLSQCGKRLANIVSWTSKKLNAPVDDFGKKGGLKAVPMKQINEYFHLANTESSQQMLRRLKKFTGSCRQGHLAFGGVVAHLKSLIVDKEVLSLSNYTLSPDPDLMHADAPSPGKAAPVAPIVGNGRLCMDAAAMQNLEIVNSCLGTERGSLLSFVDRASTPAGRRLLRKWIQEPLLKAEDIEDRLQAVEDLHMLEDMDGGTTLRKVVKHLKTKKDLERALPRLHQLAVVEDGAVMFDDTSKRRVKEFVQVVQCVKGSVNAIESLSEAMEEAGAKSKQLKWLCMSGGAIPSDVLDKLSYFLSEAFDFGLAESNGEMVPKEGAVASFDRARRELQDLNEALESELKMWQKRLRDKNVKYYHRGKEPYQLEIRNDTARGGMPDELEVVSESKTAVRYYSSKIRKLVRQRVGVNEKFEEESGKVVRNIVAQFDKDFDTWAAVGRVCAEVDALMGLAVASRDDGSGRMVRPKVLGNDHPRATLIAKKLRHPVVAGGCGNFVANDVKLGEGGDTDVMILTGPNAGGKSTLARMVGIGVVLAQMGCFVPAEEFVIRPFEEVFVRMGASDEIARGRSTFLVEMEEVGHMLNHASERSLIIADEVGRGTSTHDGHAIACATVDAMARVNQSLTVFSTHYSGLAEDVACMREKERVGEGGCEDEGLRMRIGVFEMAAEVDEVSKRITFLYQLRKGASTHSRGVYCARVAGVDGEVADDAEKAAKRMHDNLRRRDHTSWLTSFVEALREDGDATAIKLLRDL